jgi:hypothetical protein
VWSIPAQLVYVLEQWSVGSERGEFLEEKCELFILAEDFGWEVFDRAVTRNERRGALCADAFDAGETVGRIADER